MYSYRILGKRISWYNEPALPRCIRADRRIHGQRTGQIPKSSPPPATSSPEPYYWAPHRIAKFRRYYWRHHLRESRDRFRRALAVQRAQLQKTALERSEERGGADGIRTWAWASTEGTWKASSAEAAAQAATRRSGVSVDEGEGRGEARVGEGVGGVSVDEGGGGGGRRCRRLRGRRLRGQGWGRGWAASPWTRARAQERRGHRG